MQEFVNICRFLVGAIWYASVTYVTSTSLAQQPDISDFGLSGTCNPLSKRTFMLIETGEWVLLFTGYETTIRARLNVKGCQTHNDLRLNTYTTQMLLFLIWPWRYFGGCFSWCILEVLDSKTRDDYRWIAIFYCIFSFHSILFSIFLLLLYIFFMLYDTQNYLLNIILKNIFLMFICISLCNYSSHSLFLSLFLPFFLFVALSHITIANNSGNVKNGHYSNSNLIVVIITTW